MCGPRVDGTRITPTGPGEIRVHVELDAKGDRHYAEDRVYDVIAKEELVPATFRIGGCEVVADAATPTCRTRRSTLALFGVTAAGQAFEMPIQITAIGTGRSFVETYVDLGPLVGGTPSDPSYVAPGAYELELKSGELVKRFTVIYAPDATPPASR